MTRRLARVALATAVMACAMASTAPARAQVVVLTAKSAGEVLGDAKALLLGASPDPEAVKPFVAMIDGFSAPGALKGLDLAKPLGVYVDFPKAANAPPVPTVVAFIPVTDYKAFLEAIQQFGFTVEANAAAPGFSHTITPPGGLAPPLLGMSASGYAYLASDPSALAFLKTLKPAFLLPKRAGAGDLALTVHLDRLPEPMKQMALAQIKQAQAQVQEKKPDEDDAKYQSRIASMKAGEQFLMTLLNEGRELALDVTVDAKTGGASVEFSLGAKPSTSMAGAFKKLGAMKTKFRSLATGSALSAHVAVPIAASFRANLDQIIAQGKAQIDKSPGDADQKAMAGKILDALKPTLSGDALDFGMAFQGPYPAKSGGDPTIALVVAMGVKGGKKIEATVRDSVKAAKPEEKKKVSLDFAKAADGTPIHLFKGDKSPGDEAFGNPFAYVAFRDDAVIATLGDAGLDLVKKTLDATKAAAPPSALTTNPNASTGSAPTQSQVEIVVSGAKVAAMMPKKDQAVASKLSREIFAGKDAAKDKIRLTLKGEGDTVKLKLALDMAAIRFFGSLGVNHNVMVAP